MKSRLELLLAALLCMPMAANADSDLELIDTLSLEEMMGLTISASTGTDKPLSLAPAIATVITEKQIAQSTAKTFDEILEKVPGLHVYPGNGLLSGAFDIRGIHTKYNQQVMILVNGTTMQGLKYSAPETTVNMPLSAIKRIEIVRGPGSVIYGANAFAGVINIITKDADYLANTSEAGVSYGSFGTAETWLNYGAKTDGYAYAVNLSRMQSDGDDDRIMQKDLQSLVDGLYTTTASNAPGALNTDYERYNLNVNFIKDALEFNLWASTLNKGGTGAGIANALDPDGWIKYERIQSDLYYHQKLSNELKLEHKISLSYQALHTYLNVFPAGSVLTIGSDGNFGGPSPMGNVTFTDGYIGTPGDIERTAGYKATLMVESFEKHLVRLSTGLFYGDYKAHESGNFGPGIIDGSSISVDGTLTRKTGTSAIYMPDVDRKQYFFSAQDEWTFAPGWNLTAGLRYDDYSDFGSTINPRLALVWQTSPVLTSKLLYGRAFRAPSFVDMYAQNNPVGNGNPDVDPETIDTYEVAFDYFPNEQLRSVINFYYYDAKDIIDAAGTSIDNVGQQKGYGSELEVNFQATSELTLQADYAYRHTEVDNTGHAAADAPKYLAHAGANWSFAANWYADAQVFWVAERKRLATDTRKDVPNYSMVNASIGYQMEKNLKLSSGVRNLFDKDIYEPSPASGLGEMDDYKMPGRYLYAELRYSF
jgi:outer membrane receptor for ferrienterochelin and colicins